MGTNLASTYVNLTMGYHEMKVYSVIYQSHASASEHFESSWYRFSDNCQILLKFNLIKPDHLLSLLNQINNNIQLTVEKGQTRLPFLDVSGKLWKELHQLV